jgi:hypothetical protein
MVCLPLCPVISCLTKRFTVPSGSLKLIDDGRGNFEFCGAGMHQIVDPVLSGG